MNKVTIVIQRVAKRKNSVYQGSFSRIYAFNQERVLPVQGNSARVIKNLLSDFGFGPFEVITHQSVKYIK